MRCVGGGALRGCALCAVSRPTPVCLPGPPGQRAGRGLHHRSRARSQPGNESRHGRTPLLLSERATAGGLHHGAVHRVGAAGAATATQSCRKYSDWLLQEKSIREEETEGWCCAPRLAPPLQTEIRWAEELPEQEVRSHPVQSDTAKRNQRQTGAINRRTSSLLIGRLHLQQLRVAPPRRLQGALQCAVLCCVDGL